MARMEYEALSQQYDDIQNDRNRIKSEKDVILTKYHNTRLDCSDLREVYMSYTCSSREKIVNLSALSVYRKAHSPGRRAA